MKKIFLFNLILFLTFSLLKGQDFVVKENIDSRTTPQIEALIKRMTLEEKIKMLVGSSGRNNHVFNGVARLGINDLTCANGPRGVKGIGNTAFPSGISYGACWNTSLMEEVGKAIGKESKSVGVDVLLGPSINIIRDPLNGRNFEYITEDPHLNSKITSAFVTGLKSQKVISCIKHFVCNNREFNRNNYESMVDERTLREIYLPAFKAGVDAGALSLMTAANGVNGDLMSDNHHLLQEILKDEWGFKGFVITDWCATRSTEKAAFAGLDISMPYQKNSKFGEPLLKAVKNNKIPVSIIDDKVRRILYAFDFAGILDKHSVKQKLEIDRQEHYSIARRVAEESIVLLKNENNLLPLDRNKIKKIVVMGPNSNQRFCMVGLGGSSWVESEYEITPIQGIRNVAGKDINVKYVSTDDVSGFKLLTENDIVSQNGIKGFDAKYSCKNVKPIKRKESKINFVWEMASPDPTISRDNFNAEYTWSIKPKISGTYQFRITADDKAILKTGGRGGAPIAVVDIKKGNLTATANVQMKAGKTYSFKFKYLEKTGDAMCRVEWATPEQNEGYASALKKIDNQIKDADVVVFVGGIDHNLDSEGRDKSNIEFPSVQEKLINHIATVVPKTIVTLINGGQLNLGGWINNIPAVLEAWYPGMEGGTAIGEILFGKVNPSGRLPFTWVKDLKDIPMYQVDTQSKYAVHYLEEIFVGYRYFESKNVESQFPFGFGLSYTTFKYDNIKLSSNEMTENGEITVSATITNTGNYDGAEVVQMYIHDTEASVPRPIRELKGFKKIFLKAGESKTVSFVINKASLSFYDVSPNHFCWKAEPGEFIVQIGTSSHDIKLSAPFILSNHTILN